MLPYFKYTEDIHNFCMLMGFTTEITDQPTGYVCMYSLEHRKKPYITTYNLGVDMSPIIPSEKVIDYLSLMLNGYSFPKAIKELGVVGNGRLVSP